LQSDPHEQHEISRQGQQKKANEHVHAHARVKDQVRAEHARNGARGSDHGRGRRGIDGDLREGSGQAAQEVEDEEARAAHAVLHVVAKDPQKQPVAEQVRPTAVQEHGKEWRPKVDRVAIHDAVEPHAKWDRGPDSGSLGDFPWHQPEVAHSLGQPTGSRPAPCTNSHTRPRATRSRTVTTGKRNVELSSLIGIMWRKLPPP
jgi:hypothetical protein